MSVSSQFKNVPAQSPTASTSDFNAQKNSDAQGGREANHEQQRISYGYITEVNRKNYKVRVKLHAPGTRAHEILVAGGMWLPISQPLSFIHMHFGMLRKGLCVRIWWRGGQNYPGRESIIEVVHHSLAEFMSGERPQERNEMDTMAWKIFSGGSSGLA